MTKTSPLGAAAKPTSERLTPPPADFPFILLSPSCSGERRAAIVLGAPVDIAIGGSSRATGRQLACSRRSSRDCPQAAAPAARRARRKRGNGRETETAKAQRMGRRSTKAYR